MTQAERNKAVVRRFYERIDAGNFDVVDGRLVEHWSCKDELGFLRQLGVIALAEVAAGEDERAGREEGQRDGER